ncbi:MAG: hypothetical protein ACRDZX_18525 [Acidimicrobiales bacterium]
MAALKALAGADEPKAMAEPDLAEPDLAESELAGPNPAKSERTGPDLAESEQAGPNLADPNLADWLAAERRCSTSCVDLPAAGVRGRPPAESGSGRQQPGARGRRWALFTRLWALAKMAISGWSAWWVTSYLHAGLGGTVCAWGAVCFWWAAGPHWRKRCFGPGQQLEPELYEELSRWLYRAGAVLVLSGGALALARSF